MHYFDTSFLTPLLLSEATSEAVERFVGELAPGRLGVSAWTGTEFSSLLAWEVRMGALSAADALKIDAQYEMLVGASFHLLVPKADDFSLARQYLQRFETGLRADGALHLAIAFNNKVDTILSLDNTFLKAGHMLGLPVSRGV
jgi:predicted nucleic acid-binding protein